MSHRLQYWPTGGEFRPARYWPGITPGAFLLGTAVLVWLAPITGGVLDVVMTTDATPLTVAEGPATAVVGFLSFGLVHVYVPVSVPALLFVGELISATGGHRRRAIAAVFGLAAAAQLLVLTGCGCGTGSVTPRGEAALATV